MNTLRRRSALARLALVLAVTSSVGCASPTEDEDVASGGQAVEKKTAATPTATPTPTPLQVRQVTWLLGAVDNLLALAGYTRYDPAPRNGVEQQVRWLLRQVDDLATSCGYYGIGEPPQGLGPRVEWLLVQVQKLASFQGWYGIEDPPR